MTEDILNNLDLHFDVMKIYECKNLLEFFSNLLYHRDNEIKKTVILIQDFEKDPYSFYDYCFKMSSKL